MTYRGKTLDEWREYIKKDKQVGIRTTKYIIVLEEIIEELSKLQQGTTCDQEKIHIQYNDELKVFDKVEKPI